MTDFLIRWERGTRDLHSHKIVMEINGEEESKCTWRSRFYNLIMEFTYCHSCLTQLATCYYNLDKDDTRERIKKKSSWKPPWRVSSLYPSFPPNVSFTHRAHPRGGLHHFLSFSAAVSVGFLPSYLGIVLWESPHSALEYTYTWLAIGGSDSASGDYYNHASFSKIG